MTIKKGYFEKGRFIEVKAPKPPTQAEINKLLNEEINDLEEKIISLSKTLNKRIEDLENNYGNLHFHADIGYRENSEVIICGKLNGKDYVQKYIISHDEVSSLIDILKHLEKSMQRGRLDQPTNWMF